MNPNNFTEEELTQDMQKTLNSAKSFVLSAQEKAKLRDDLSAHIKSGVIISDFRKDDFNANTNTRKSFTVHDFFGLSKQVYLMPALVLVFIFLGTGTSYLAQGSLPGDALYSVKTGVNENLESLMALSPETQADVALKQAIERLSEVDTIKSSGSELSEVQTLAVQSNFSKKVESLNKNIEKARKKGRIEKADKLTKDFEKELDDHFDAFVTISNSASNSPTFSGIFASRNTRYGDTNVLAMSSKIASRSGDSEDDDWENESEDRDGDDEEDDDRNDTSVMSFSAPTTSTTTVNTAGISLKSYSLSEVAMHASSTNCWTAVSGGVYNLTKWISAHPGGDVAIKSMCGIDATKIFLNQHTGDKKPLDTIATFKIGIVK